VLQLAGRYVKEIPANIGVHRPTEQIDAMSWGIGSWMYDGGWQKRAGSIFAVRLLPFTD